MRTITAMKPTVKKESTMFVHAQDRATDIADIAQTFLSRDDVSRIIWNVPAITRRPEVRAVLKRIRRAALEVESLAARCELVAKAKEEKPGRHRHRASHQRAVWKESGRRVRLDYMLEVCRCGASRHAVKKGAWD